MSEENIAIETIYQQSDQDDGMDRSNPESKEERALLIQRNLLAEQHWFQNLEVTEIFMKVFLKGFAVDGGRSARLNVGCSGRDIQ